MRQLRLLAYERGAGGIDGMDVADKLFPRLAAEGAGNAVRGIVMVVVTVVVGIVIHIQTAEKLVCRLDKLGKQTVGVWCGNAGIGRGGGRGTVLSRKTGIVIFDKI